MHIKTFRRSSLLACTGIVVIATAAVAGSGVGGIFNLGQVNTVNARTQLQGATSSQQLYVVNTSASASSTAVRGSATATTGVHYGVFGTTSSRDGLAGFFRNTGTPTVPTRGTAVQGLGAGATGTEFPSANFAGGGEFAGPNGVVGYSTFNGGAGVAGFTGTKGDIGIYGVSTDVDGYAGFFQNFASATDPYKGAGIRALAAGATGSEIPSSFRRGGGEFIGPNGVIGAPSRSDGYGVLAIRGPGFYALFARGRSYIDGDLYVAGTLTKAFGTFKIDHPLDPENKYLSHSFVESPDMMNIYNGNVVTDAEGTAVVELPGYFEALNRDPRYQLTVIGSFAAAQIADEISNNRFVIRTSEPGVKVSWQVTGIRQDAYARQHPIVVEDEKAVADRGRYLYPEAFGKPTSLAIGPGLGQVAAK
jgi:hypothetical protein